MTSEDLLMAVLATPYDKAYRVSADGLTYSMPGSFFGVPVAKIEETGPYWVHTWASLDRYLAQEADTEAKKATAHNMLQSDPTNKVFRARYKEAQDNVSKARKIREIFGPDTRYHPNQIVNKRHMPVTGICDLNYMYRLACKVSDMKILHLRGELAMDPFDFVRWRISLRIEQRLKEMPGSSAASFVKTIISKIAGDDDDNKCNKYWSDPEFRAAVRKAAIYCGRINSFGKKKKRSKEHAPPASRPAQRSRPGPNSTAGRLYATSALKSVNSQQRLEERQKRRAARPATTIYNGVQAYREKKQEAARPPLGSSNAPRQARMAEEWSSTRANGYAGASLPPRPAPTVAM